MFFTFKGWEAYGTFCRQPITNVFIDCCLGWMGDAVTRNHAKGKKNLAANEKGATCPNCDLSQPDAETRKKLARSLFWNIYTQPPDISILWPYITPFYGHPLWDRKMTPRRPFCPILHFALWNPSRSSWSYIPPYLAHKTCSACSAYRIKEHFLIEEKCHP